MRMIKLPLAVVAILVISGCSTPGTEQEALYPQPTYQGSGRTFTLTFNSIEEFTATGFYHESGEDYDSRSTLSETGDPVKEGAVSHKAVILLARDTDNNSTTGYKPHRAYPTLQFQKATDGIYRTPCLVTLWVYLDTPELRDLPDGQVDDWISLVTLSPDPADTWSRTVVVNLVHDGYLRLVHVPEQGEQQRIYQLEAADDPAGEHRFPQREWVRLDILIDFAETEGYAKVWQNGHLVSHAAVNGGNGGLAQAHFGLYASAALASGTVYNDRLRITEVDDEEAALVLVNGEW